MIDEAFCLLCLAESIKWLFRSKYYYLESWLKAFSDEPTPKKKKKKKKSDKGNHFDDGLSVLDAAGFTGRQFSWTKTLSSKDSS